MPFRVTIDHEQRLISSVWEGDVDETLCTAYIEDVWGDPAVGAYDELVDFRAVTNMDLPTEAIQRLVSRSRAVADPETVSRSVLVATADLVYGLSRMYVSFRNIDGTHKREWEVMDDIEMARRWLQRE